MKEPVLGWGQAALLAGKCMQRPPRRPCLGRHRLIGCRSASTCHALSVRVFVISHLATLYSFSSCTGMGWLEKLA